MSQSQPTSSYSNSPAIVHPAGMVAVDSERVWIVDSGASRHFCGDETSFIQLHRFFSPQFVRMADGSPSPILGYGDVMVLPSLCAKQVLYGLD
ncbi:hypothetical protein QML37_29995, partial [Klebsiella pneumoniae]|uniref:hypothetical protein n=1 Tax=Klebsiella pneumoniae TaxID=573 RepID=UPI003A801D17